MLGQGGEHRRLGPPVGGGGGQQLRRQGQVAVVDHRVGREPGGVAVRVGGHRGAHVVRCDRLALRQGETDPPGRRAGLLLRVAGHGQGSPRLGEPAAQEPVPAQRDGQAQPAAVRQRRSQVRHLGVEQRAATAAGRPRAAPGRRVRPARCSRRRAARAPRRRRSGGPGRTRPPIRAAGSGGPRRSRRAPPATGPPAGPGRPGRSAQTCSAASGVQPSGNTASRASTTRSVSSSRSQLQPITAVSVRCRGGTSRCTVVSNRKRSSSRSTTPRTPSARTRVAASSNASGRPSRRRQSWATAVARLLVEAETALLRGGAGDEQPGRRRAPDRVQVTVVRHRQRGYLPEQLTGQPERLPAGGQHAHPGHVAQQPGDQLGDRFDDVFAVVQHEQQLPVPQGRDHPVGGGQGRAGGLVGAQRAEHLFGDARVTGRERGQLDQLDAVRAGRARGPSRWPAGSCRRRPARPA